MNKHLPFATKFISVIVLFSIILTLTPTDALAVDTDDATRLETVRLGYFDFQNYMLGAEEGEVKSGYVYELLCDVATINNWKYEYVYGDFDDLYVMLLKGDIDILPCLVYTDERAANHYFSDEEIYKEEYFISTLSENAKGEIDISDLNGKRLSSVSNCYQNEVFEKWAEEHGISMEFVLTGSFEDSWKQLNDGKADYVLNIDSAANGSGFTSLFEVGAGSSRFAIAPGREDILEKFNSAIDTIYDINPFSLEHLKEKYLSATLSSYKLSNEELEYAESVGIIRIAGFADDAPYSYYDESGDVIGVYPNAVKEMFRRLEIDLKAEWILFESEDDMYKALMAGDVDLICPSYSNHYYAESNGMIISEELQNIHMGILYRDNTNETDINKIAIPASRMNEYYVSEYYPFAEIIKCDSVKECIDNVSSEKADAAVAHVMALQNKSVDNMKTFRIKTLVAGCPICFAARPKNGILIRIMDRGVHLITESDLQNLESEYSLDRSYDLRNYIKNNKLVALFIFLTIIILLLYAIERNVASRKLKLNQQKLVEAEAAANAANKAKSVFLFNMSHDIRTPMNAIIGYSDRLIKHVDDRDVVKDSAEKIKSSGGYLLSLINDVLDMARIESDQIKLDLGLYDIKEKVFALCAVFEVDMQKKDITFNVDLSDMKDSVVWYDSKKLKQIMLNLISNAVKYTPDGGTITCTMHQKDCNREGYGLYEIIVSDTGIGMSKEFIDRIFDRFSRSDDSITKETQGTGLGMSIVKKLVDLMSGTIDVESEQGKGSKFTIKLELKKATEEELGRLEEEKEEKKEKEEEMAAELKILIVDDNELNRDILQEILEDEGCVITGIAVNGEDALKKVSESEKEDFDLILMDVQMPVMDGYEATRRIRALENRQLANIPIFAMTANAFEEDRKNALEAGMNDHLTKPVDVNKLKEALRRVYNI